MSNKYKYGDKIPLEVITARLLELIEAITAGDYGKSVEREFTMRVPAELDRDADCILSEASLRLESQERDIAELADSNGKLIDRLDMARDEFIRISIISNNSEVTGICDRAMLELERTSPVLEQRDKMESALNMIASAMATYAASTKKRTT